MQAYVRHKVYYDKKASANPLVVNDYCYALHPKAHSQSTKLPFRDYLWTGPYIVVKTLPNNNYLLQKLQTKLTQILHRIRLRPFKITHKLPDISTPLKDFQQDNEVIIQHDDLYALAWQEHYQKGPTHLGNSPSPEPKLIPPNTETADETTHPDPMPEPESISNHLEAQADDLALDIADEPEDSAPTPKSPGNQSTTFDKTRPRIGSRISLTTTL